MRTGLSYMIYDINDITHIKEKSKDITLEEIIMQELVVSGLMIISMVISQILQKVPLVNYLKEMGGFSNGNIGRCERLFKVFQSI